MATLRQFDKGKVSSYLASKDSYKMYFEKKEAKKQQSNSKSKVNIIKDPMHGSSRDAQSMASRININVNNLIINNSPGGKKLLLNTFKIRKYKPAYNTLIYNY